MATNIGGGKSSGTIESPAGDGGRLSSGGGPANSMAPGMGKEAGLISANAAAQVQLDTAALNPESDPSSSETPVILAQAASQSGAGASQAAAIAAVSSSKVLGTITSMVGEVKATAPDGTVRILQVGDKVF